MIINYPRLIAVVFLGALISVISCKKDIDPPIAIDETWNCYHQKQWSNQDIHDSLIGSWELKYGGLYSTDVQSTPKEQNGKFVEFSYDSVFIFNAKRILILASTWVVTDGDADTYSLKLKNSIVGLYGRILICGDWVIFNSSYRDGVDSYFRRSE